MITANTIVIWLTFCRLELQNGSSDDTDFDAVSSYVASLMAVKENEPDSQPLCTYKFRRLALPSLLGNSIEPAESVSTIYSKLVQAWVDPIRDKIDLGYLAANDSVVRRVAIDCFLGSVGVQLCHGKENISGNGNVSQEQSDLSLSPVRHGRDNNPSSKESAPTRKDLPSTKADGVSASMRLSYRLARPQALITRSSPIPTIPWSQPSSIPTSQPSERRAEVVETQEDHALDRLRAYATIEAPPRCSRPALVSSLMTHWTIGADPTHYSWDDSQRALHLRNHTTTIPIGDGSQAGLYLSSSQTTNPPQASHKRKRHSHHHPHLQPQSQSQPSQFETSHNDNGSIKEEGVPKITTTQSDHPSSNTLRGPRVDGVDEARRRYPSMISGGGGGGDRGGDESAMDFPWPMTQTEPGLFGSRRSTHHPTPSNSITMMMRDQRSGKKKQQQRRAAGF